VESVQSARFNLFGVDNMTKSPLPKAFFQKPMELVPWVAHARRIYIALLSCFLFSPPASSQIAPNAVVSVRETSKAAVTKLEVEERFPLSQLFHLTITDGVLSGELLADFPDQIAARRVEVEGSDALWTVRKRQLGAAGNIYIMLSRYDYEAPADQPWCTNLTINSGNVALYTTQGDNNSGQRVRLTQSKSSLSFTIAAINQGVQQMQFQATAQTMQQLIAEHPQEVRQYLVPLIHNLTGRFLLHPGPSDVYRLFDSIPADPAVMTKLDAILGRLESDNYAERNKAGKELASKGPPFVLAALRRDPADLSAEAKNHLEQFIAKNSNATLDNLAAARKDRSLLLDCLEDEDPAVRSAAKTALEKAIGKSIDFETNLESDERLQAVDALRKKYDTHVRPTTRPIKN
jgi:hypothetical protein